MPRTLTAADRSALIRLASTMPKGDTTRRSILAGLQKVSVKEHATEADRRKWLREHPNADPKNHIVRERSTGKHKSLEPALAKELDKIVQQAARGKKFTEEELEPLYKKLWDKEQDFLAEVASHQEIVDKKRRSKADPESWEADQKNLDSARKRQQAYQAARLQLEDLTE